MRPRGRVARTKPTSEGDRRLAPSTGASKVATPAVKPVLVLIPGDATDDEIAAALEALDVSENQPSTVPNQSSEQGRQDPS